MHASVLMREVLERLAIRPGGRYVDGTAGSGGHAEAVLAHSAPDGLVLAMDRDPEAVERTRARLAPYGERAMVVCANHARMAEVARLHGFEAVDGVLLDLGVSSDQLDNPERGFSFSADGPLDLRMGPDAAMTAADLLAGLPDWRALAHLLGAYGEVPRAGAVARAIWAEQQRQPIRSTGRLAAIVERARGGRAGRARHPATQVFQALRIAVNGELEALDAALEGALEILKSDGRLAVISFHSLEDRRVKHTFREHAGAWESLPQGGQCWRARRPEVEIETRKPIRPGDEECARNRRARSALLRVARRRTHEEEISHGTT